MGDRSSVTYAALVLGATAVLAVSLMALPPPARLATVIERFEQPDVPLTIAADDRTCAIGIRGDFDNTLYQGLRHTLETHPGTHAVLLNSAGGSAFGITRVAELLREHNVATAVMYGQCDSACAFLWVSMPRRIIASAGGNDAPGFHAPHLTLPWLGRVRALTQDTEQRSYLGSVGLPQSFIDWAYVPLDNLWRPDARALSSIGVTTRSVRTRFPEKLSFCT